MWQARNDDRSVVMGESPPAATGSNVYGLTAKNQKNLPRGKAVRSYLRNGAYQTRALNEVGRAPLINEERIAFSDLWNEPPDLMEHAGRAFKVAA